MSRAARLLEIMIALRTRPRFTVQELADRFGVSRRTMLRDLQELSASGAPLAASPGPHGGYQLIAKQPGMPLALTLDEAVGMTLAYESFLMHPASPFSSNGIPPITKLRAALPDGIIGELERLREYVVLSAPERRYQAPLLDELLQAALQHLHLNVVYDSRGGSSTRLIFPFGIFAEQGYWYCAAYDYRRRANLSLRADRFRSLETVEGYDEPHTLSLRSWLKTRESNAREPLRLRAVIRSDALKRFDIELEALFGIELFEDNGDGVVDTMIPAGEVDYFAGRLLAFGGGIRVISPAEMIDAIQRQAETVLSLYQASGDEARNEGG